MKKCRPFLTLVSVLTLFVCNAQTSGKIKTISAVDFANLISTTFGPQILDVQSPEEFESNHIKNAVNNSWLGNSFSTTTENLNKSKPVFVYCKSGNRSGKAVKKLEELGFTSIYELDGGLQKWDAAGMKKLKSKTEGMTIENYENQLVSEKIVLISFKTDCTTCKQIETYLQKLEKEFSEKLTIIQLDANENKTLLSELDIQELPTLLIYKNKNISWRHSGFISEEDLRKQLQ